MAITLVEAAKLAANQGKQIKSAVIEMFARASDILQVLPINPIDGNAYAYNREGALPGVGFRKINNGFNESTGIINQLTETLRPAGGDLDVDTFITRTMGMGIRAAHEELKVKALAAEITRCFVKGDSSNGSDEFDGLQARISGNQLIPNSNADGGGVLSLAKLDEAIDAVVSPTHILMSKAQRRLLNTASRTSGLSGILETSKDAFGRTIRMYNGLPILVPYSDNGGTEPIGFNELGASGSTATASSIYVLALGEGMVCGIESKAGMMVRDLGELDTKPALRTRVEWDIGLVIEHGRAAARLYGIGNGTVVA